MRVGSSAAAAALLLLVSACGSAGTPTATLVTQYTTTESSVGTTTSSTPTTPSRKAEFLVAANLACQSLSGKSLAAPRSSESKAALHAYAAGAVSETRHALILLEQVAAGRREQAVVRPLLADYAKLLGDYGILESSSSAAAAGLLARITAEQRQAGRLARMLGVPSCAPASL